MQGWIMWQLRLYPQGIGVPGVNENGDKLVELCSKKGIMVRNMGFLKRYVHKYVKVSGIGGLRVLIEYVLTDRSAEEKLLDVNMLRNV